VRGDVPKNAACWRDEGRKKKLSCVKLAISPDHPRRCSPLKFCMLGCVLEVVIYFKFHENRSRRFGAVVGSKSPSPIDKAYTTDCTIVQAVVVPTTRAHEFQPHEFQPTRKAIPLPLDYGCE